MHLHPLSQRKRVWSVPVDVKHPPNAKAQASELTFELHTLGWKAFQDLCVAIAEEVIKRPVETFLPSKDGGRDAAFVGCWGGDPTAPEAGKSTIQCKFTSRADSKLNLGGIKDEIEKAKRLAASGLAEDYIILTNHFISGEANAAICAAFEAVGVKRCRVFGASWITDQIRRSPRLRIMVPRVYGLGDLSQILDERAYAQSRAILSALGEDLARFVITDAHRKSVKALLDHQFVLLLGDPASGKSTIAASLALGALDHWGCPTVRINSPEELTDRWNPHGGKQFFWIDDAFGATQYQRQSTDAWNRQIPVMVTALKKGAHFLLTSRTYIWEAAQRDLKKSAFPLFDQSQVIIDVQGLTDEEKAQIIYNHIKLGDQSPEFRTAVKPFLAELASDRAFLPETARRLGSRFFTAKLELSRSGVLDFARRPVEFLKDVLQNLDRNTAAAVSLVFMHGGSVPSPIEGDERTQVIADLLGVQQAELRSALSFLRGSLLLLVDSPEGKRWTFKHPTIADAYAVLVSDSPELTEIYLRGAKLDRLLREVVCSGVSIEGASVHVPRRLYPLLVDRITTSDFWSRFSVPYFLAERCDREFLELYLEKHPDLVTPSVIPFMSYSSDIRVLARLRELDLLPEDKRLDFITQAGDVTVKTPDGAIFKDDSLRSLFSEEELHALLERVKAESLPNIREMIREWEENCGSDDDPESHFEEFEGFLNEVEDHFVDSEQVASMVQSARSEIKTKIDSINESREPPEDAKVQSPNSVAPKSSSGLEQIFDDVDE